MKLIESNAAYIPQQEGLEGVYKQIELAGRTCYKSEDKITSDSAKGFVDRMINSKHTAMLEHGTVYLTFYTIDKEDWDKKVCRNPRPITLDEAREHLRVNPDHGNNGEENWWTKEARHIAYRALVKYSDNPYSKANVSVIKHEINVGDGGVLITPGGSTPTVRHISKRLKKFYSYIDEIHVTTNLRVLVENGWLEDLRYLCEPTKHHERRYTFKFVTDRGVSHELVRHRVFSFAQESTRYCNYSKDKYGNEITYIIPSWLSGKVKECSYHTMIEDINFLEQLAYDRKLRTKTGWFTSAFIEAEKCYLEALKAGASPQEARAVLPNAVKTEICMTGFASDWRDFLALRLFGKTGAPHPDMKLLASKARDKMEEAGILEDILRYPDKFDNK